MVKFILAYLLMTAAVNASADSTLGCVSKTTLSFGMVPMTSANLTEVWASRINRQIEKKSCIKLSFGSAVNFKHYIEKAKQGSFDVLAAPAHIASYLIATAGFKPVAFLAWESSYLYVVPIDSSISSLNQIMGSTLALPDPLAEVSILVQQEMSVINPNVNFQYYQNFNQIIHALLSGNTDVGVVLSPFYKGYKKRVDIKARILDTVPFPSHGMLLAAPHTSEHDQAQLFKALAALEPNSDLFWQSFEAVSPPEIEQLHRDQATSVKALKLLVDK